MKTTHTHTLSISQQQQQHARTFHLAARAARVIRPLLHQQRCVDSLGVADRARNRRRLGCLVRSAAEERPLVATQRVSLVLVCTCTFTSASTDRTGKPGCSDGASITDEHALSHVLQQAQRPPPAHARKLLAPLFVSQCCAVLNLNAFT
jgi:hypothetical protein